MAHIFGLELTHDDLEDPLRSIQQLSTQSPNPADVSSQEQVLNARALRIFGLLDAANNSASYSEAIQQEEGRKFIFNLILNARSLMKYAYAELDQEFWRVRDSSRFLCAKDVSMSKYITIMRLVHPRMSEEELKARVESSVGPGPCEHPGGASSLLAQFCYTYIHGEHESLKNPAVSAVAAARCEIDVIQPSPLPHMMIHCSSADYLVAFGAGGGHRQRHPFIEVVNPTTHVPRLLKPGPGLYTHAVHMVDDPAHNLLWFSGDQRIRAVNMQREKPSPFEFEDSPRRYARRRDGGSGSEESDESSSFSSSDREEEEFEAGLAEMDGPSGQLRYTANVGSPAASFLIHRGRLITHGKRFLKEISVWEIDKMSPHGKYYDLSDLDRRSKHVSTKKPPLLDLVDQSYGLFDFDANEVEVTQGEHRHGKVVLRNSDLIPPGAGGNMGIFGGIATGHDWCLLPQSDIAVCDAGWALALLDLQSECVSRAFAGHTGMVTSISTTTNMPDTFLTSGSDSFCKMWDVRTRLGCTTTLDGSDRAVNSACFAVQGGIPFVFAGGDSESIRCWDLRFNKSLYKLSTGNNKVHSLVWHSATQSLFAATENGYQDRNGTLLDYEIESEEDRLRARAGFETTKSNRTFPWPQKAFHTREDFKQLWTQSDHSINCYKFSNGANPSLFNPEPPTLSLSPSIW